MRIMEKEMATHSSILAWRIPGMGEPGGLQSMGSQRVGHDGSDLAHKHVRIPVGFFVEIDESESVSHSVVSDSLPSSGLQPTRLLCPWNSPGNTGVSSHFLLQGIFQTQGSNLGLLHCRQILCHMNHQGSPIFSAKPWDYLGQTRMIGHPRKQNVHSWAYATNLDCSWTGACLNLSKPLGIFKALKKNGTFVGSSC